MNLLSLPTETLDQIIFNVDEHADILNISLANKFFYSIADPAHLNFRDIRTELVNEGLWKTLAEGGNLASNVRSLTVLPDDQGWDLNELIPDHCCDIRERVPPGFSLPNDDNLKPRDSDLEAQNSPDTSSESGSESSEPMIEGYENFIAALKQMSHLRRFRWYGSSTSFNPRHAIWSTLNKYCMIEDIEVFDVAFPGDGASSREALEDAFNEFKNLRSFRIRTSACRRQEDAYGVDNWVSPGLPKVLNMLVNQCPNLEVLALELDELEDDDGAISLNPLLNNANWPKLRVFRTLGMTSTVGALQRFLIAHPTIEELSLSSMIPGRHWIHFELPKDALPNLHHLECSSSQATCLLSPSRPIKTLLNIEVHDRVSDRAYFSVNDPEAEALPESEESNNNDTPESNVLSESPWRNLFLQRLQAQRSITHLGTSERIANIGELGTFAAVAPQLTRFSLHCVWASRMNRELPDADWFQFFSSFPNLEVIQGGPIQEYAALANEGPFKLSLERAIATEKKGNAQIQALGRACPRMRVILGHDRWKKGVIIRDLEPGQGVRWAIRKWEDTEEPYAQPGERVYGP